MEEKYQQFVGISFVSSLNVSLMCVVGRLSNLESVPRQDLALIFAHLVWLRIISAARLGSGDARLFSLPACRKLS